MHPRGRQQKVPQHDGDKKKKKKLILSACAADFRMKKRKDNKCKKEKEGRLFASPHCTSWQRYITLCVSLVVKTWLVKALAGCASLHGVMAKPCRKGKQHGGSLALSPLDVHGKHGLVTSAIWFRAWLGSGRYDAILDSRFDGRRRLFTVRATGRCHARDDWQILWGRACHGRVAHLHQETSVIDNSWASRSRREYGASGSRAVVDGQLTCIIYKNTSRWNCTTVTHFAFWRMCWHIALRLTLT